MANNKSNVVTLPTKPKKTAPAESASKFKFTTNRLQKLAAPATGCRYVYDTEVAGLCLRVTRAGVKTYVLYRRVTGRPERINLGRMGAITLQAARDAASRLNGRLAAGVDVVRERRAARARGITVGELFAAWLRSAKARKLRSLESDENMWRRHLDKKLAKKEASSLGTQDIQRLVDDIAAMHPRTANRCVALLSRVYNTGLKKGIYTGNNPVKSVDRQPERSRERYMKPDELPRFVAAVEEEGEPWRGYFLLLLYTGGRSAAVASMQWQDVDLVSNVWTVPSWASKNGKTLHVPLTPEAVNVLEGLEATKVGTWVFPSEASRSGHIETPIKPWRRVCKRAGLEGLRPHDVRRTVGSWMAAGGASNFMISKALGHMSPHSAAVYARLDTEPVRQVLSKITAGWKSSPKEGS